MRKKLWIAISTPFQVNFFRPLIQRLKEEVDLLVTARVHNRIIPMLEAMGLPYVKVGRHGGKRLESKLKAYAKTVFKLASVVRSEKPDLLLTERWPEAVRVAFGYNIPAWTLFYDERERFVNRMVFPLSSKVFAPTFYNKQELRRHGVINLGGVVWFRGFHTCYLKDFKPDPRKDPFKGLSRPLLLVRPEPEVATYFERKKPVLREVVRLLMDKGDFNVVVMPRTVRQRRLYGRLGVKILDEVTIEHPVAYADVVLGAAETMLMESFVLGVPAISAVYWKASKPVAYLHGLIPHSVNENVIVEYAYKFIDYRERARFTKEAKSVVAKMDNPIEVILNQLKNEEIIKLQ
jgi:hypothetical protein